MPVLKSMESATPIPPNEEPGAILTQISAAMTSGSNGGEIILELTEDQLTAAANEALQYQDQEEIRDLRVDLADGIVTVTGQMNQNGFDLPLTLKLSIAVDESGSPYITIQDGKLGPFPLPENIIAQLKEQFDQILQSQINPAHEDILIKSISVNDETIIIIAENR
jgi:uncharacterized protein YpmS